MDRTTHITKTVADAVTYTGELEDARKRRAKGGENWEPSTRERVILWSDEHQELGLRVYPSGRKSWVLRYAVNGRRRMMVLGRYPVLTTKTVMDRMKEELRRVYRGTDPIEEARKVKLETVSSAWAHFKTTAMQSMRESTRRNLRGTYRKHLKRWADRRLDAITKHDVERLHANLAEESVYAANDAVRLLRRLFDAADVVDPSRKARLGGRKKGQLTREKKRTRYLSAGELRALAGALAEETDEDVVDFIRLLMVTGARPFEWRLARWEWLDLEQGVWRIPREVLKIELDEEYQTRQIPSTAVQILAERRDRQEPESKYIFPRSGGQRPHHRNWISKPWRRLAERAGLSDDVTPYILRHTFGTHALQSGLSLPATAALMGHVDKTTTLERYAHAVDTARRAAAETVAEEIETLMGVSREGRAEVVKIGEARR